MCCRRRLCVPPLIAIAILSGGQALAGDLSYGLALMYSNASLSRPTDAQMTVCYGFNCQRRWRLDFTKTDRKDLARILNAGRASAAAERKSVQQVVVWLDRRIGPIIGTEKRVARANIQAGDPAHNFDCIDTTRNISSFLLVLEQWNLLRHHVVGDPRYRGNVFIGQLPHNTAVLKDRLTKIDWAVDMWPRGYGESPDLMTLERWLNEI
jgi:hypothetical protein